MKKEINSKVSVTFQFDDDEVAALRKTIEIIHEIVGTITDYNGEYLDPDAVLDCGWDKISRNDLAELARQLGYILEVIDGTEGVEIC